MHALHARRCWHRKVVRGYRHWALDTQQCAKALSRLGHPQQQLDASGFETPGGLCRRKILHRDESVTAMVETRGDVRCHRRLGREQRHDKEPHEARRKEPVRAVLQMR